MADGETRRNNRGFINMGASPVTLTSAPKKNATLVESTILACSHSKTPPKEKLVSDFNPSENMEIKLEIFPNFSG